MRESGYDLRGATEKGEHCDWKGQGDMGALEKKDNEEVSNGIIRGSKCRSDKILGYFYKTERRTIRHRSSGTLLKTE